MSRHWSVVLVIPLLLGLTACASADPPDPTPVGQVCEQVFTHLLPVPQTRFNGKTTTVTYIYLPQYRTDCWIEGSAG